MDTLEYIKKRFELDLSGTQPTKIANFGRAELAKVFAELNFKLGAEIGVDRGTFSKILCRNNPQLHLCSIDPWDTSAFEGSSNNLPVKQSQFEGHYKYAKHRLSSYNCTLIRTESLSAIKDFPDKSLDFVYIDANHNFVNIANDIYFWEKKVKTGGIVSGHDYQHFPPAKDNHVKQVVDAYIQSFEISPYFELEQDKYNSWFWVK